MVAGAISGVVVIASLALGIFYLKRRRRRRLHGGLEPKPNDILTKIRSSRHDSEPLSLVTPYIPSSTRVSQEHLLPPCPHRQHAENAAWVASSGTPATWTIAAASTLSTPPSLVSTTTPTVASSQPQISKKARIRRAELERQIAVARADLVESAQGSSSRAGGGQTRYTPSSSASDENATRQRVQELEDELQRVREHIANAAPPAYHAPSTDPPTPVLMEPRRTGYKSHRTQK
jgi:hypothetical protein